MGEIRGMGEAQMTRIVLALALICAAGAAQAKCLPHAEMVEELRKRFGEVRRIAGVTPVSVTEWFVNEKSGSWTLVVTNTSGIACIRGAGQGATFFADEDGA